MIVSLNFFGEDFCAEVDYSVSRYGHPSNGWCDPGEAHEFEIDRIALSRDTPLSAEQHKLFKRGHRFTPQFEATGALFDVLANLDAINDAICQEIDASGPPEPDYDDRDF